MAQPVTKTMPNGVIGKDVITGTAKEICINSEGMLSKNCTPAGQNAEASQEDVLNVDEHLPEYKEFVASTDHSNKKKKKRSGKKRSRGSKFGTKREGDVTSPATRYARLPPALRLAPLIRQRAQEIQLRPV
ncbi:hypothetical protein ACJJTC_003958 [Scirpophaga incertulas]